MVAEGQVPELLRHFLDLTETRIDTVHAALGDGDVLRAWRVLYWAEEAFGLAVDRWYAPAIAFGEKFSKRKSTESATRGRGRKAISRENHVVEMARKFLEQKKGRFRNGKINRRALAKEYRRDFGTHLGERRVREIIGDAIRDDKLA